jgi:DNA-binding NarL/FixJ family response regulator
VRATHADVLLLDITMPGALFPDILMRLSEERAELRVLVLSMHPEQQYAVRALRNGAAGYLTKDRSPEELITAIRTVASGGRYVTSTMADRLAAVLGSDPFVPLHERLSDREHEVLGLLAAGKTLRQIAERLSVSPKTVSTYRARIIRKLHMRTNAELIRYALENGLGN